MNMMLLWKLNLTMILQKWERCMKKIDPRDLLDELHLPEAQWNGYHGRRKDYKYIKKVHLPIYDMED